MAKISAEKSCRFSCHIGASSLRAETKIMTHVDKEKTKVLNSEKLKQTKTVEGKTATAVDDKLSRVNRMKIKQLLSFIKGERYFLICIPILLIIVFYLFRFCSILELGCKQGLCMPFRNNKNL